MGGNGPPLARQDAGSHSIRLLGQDSVSQDLQASVPFRKDPPGNGRDIHGMVHPSGTPIIHSIKDGARICAPKGFAALPDNPYSTPIKYDARLVDFSHDSLERR